MASATLLVISGIPEWVPYVAAVVAIVAVIWAISAYYERKRSEALSAAASQLGFSFSTKDEQQAPHLQTALFQKGHGKEFRNIMSGTAGNLRAVLFDYKYTVGGGRYSHVYRQTVAAYSKTGSQLPVIEIRQRGIWLKMFSGKGVRFDSHPEFSRRTYVRCADEMRAQSVFTPGLLSFLDQLDAAKKWRFEGQGDTLLVYRSEKKVKPTDLQNFLHDTSSLATQFFAQANR